MKRACGDCAFFLELDEKVGACRRNPPAARGELGALWPVVMGYGDDWCGEFSRKRGEGDAAREFMARHEAARELRERGLLLPQPWTPIPEGHEVTPAEEAEFARVSADRDAELAEREKRALRNEIDRLTRAEAEALAVLEGMARQWCGVDTADATLVDSMAISANAEALELLAQHRRFRVDAAAGRRVIGRWPAEKPT